MKFFMEHNEYTLNLVIKKIKNTVLKTILKMIWSRQLSTSFIIYIYIIDLTLFSSSYFLQNSLPKKKIIKEKVGGPRFHHTARTHSELFLPLSNSVAPSKNPLQLLI